MNEDQLVDRLVTLTLEVDGRIVIAENVPALAAEDSGDRHFSPETVRRLEELLHGERKPGRVVATPVFNFAN